MKTRVRLLACLAALGLFLVLFPGCYTQVGATRGDDDRDQDRGYQPQGQYQDSSYAEEGDHRDSDEYYGNDDGWHSRPSVGFSYYYPSSYCWPSAAFNAAYYDPWAFNFGFNYFGYGGGYYTPYPYNYAGYYSQYYPYGYSPNAYYKYGYAQNPNHRGVRSFGDTRGVSTGGRGATTNTNGYVAPPVVNTDRGGYNFPRGARVSPNPTGAPASHGSTPSTVTPRSTSRERSSSVRGGSRSANGRSGPAVRGWGGRRGVVQTDPRREARPAKPAGRGTQQAAPPTRDNGRGRESGVQRGSTPAPRPQAPSSTPPGGGRSSGSGRHDGGGRR